MVSYNKLATLVNYYDNLTSLIYFADLPGSLQAAVRCLLDDTDYMSVVRAAILGGGCNCSRVSFIGACLGAKYGLGSIALEWIQKTDSAKHAIELAIRLAQL